MKKTERNTKTLNAKLFVRILPTIDVNYDSVKIDPYTKVMYVRCSQDLTKGTTLKNHNYWYFCTDGIFWNTCQSEVYETVTSGLFDELFEGIRALILCYGQTGSGKTFTSSGLRFQYQNRGLILRILSKLFKEEEVRRDVKKISFGVSYLEFVGETVKDLIGDKTIQNIREVLEYPLKNEEWGWKQIFNAEARKSFSDTAPYKGSNRGHTVLTFHVHSESLIDTDPIINHSKIHIVDMGGIDNLGNKPSFWKNKSDLGNSNLSKSLLEQVILCLIGEGWKNENHICPYKSSRFLLYLSDTLKPKCLIRFIAHVYGNDSNIPITLSTLKFGEKIRAFRPAKLERVYEPNFQLQMRHLENELLRLKDEIELNGMINNSQDCTNISQDQLLEIRRAAEGFLFGQIKDLTLFSLGQASLTLEVFKDLYQKLLLEKEQVIKDAVAIATETLQAQLTLEKISACNLPIVPNVQNRSSRRKSRQLDSQISFGTSFRSSDSGQIGVIRGSSIVQQVGVTDRKGISLGPGKTSTSFEGNITKAFKKLKSRKSESIIKGIKTTTTKEFGISPWKNQTVDDFSELPLGQEIPSPENAWQNFLKERPDAANELRSYVEIYEGEAVVAKKKYHAALAELTKLREEIEDCKMELENCLHIRQIYGKKNSEEGENCIPKDFEKNFMASLAQKEEQVNGAIENCHVALIDLRNAVEELNEAKKNLDDAFQEFCKEQYKTSIMSDEIISSQIKSEESGKNICTESDLKKEAFMELYIKLQEKLFNYTKKRSKKEWQKLF